MQDEFVENADFVDSTEDAMDNTSADFHHDDAPYTPQRPSLFGRLLGAIGLNPQAKIAENEARLATLSRVIRHHPEVAENYVLRGEVNLALKRYDDAIADFQTALTSLTIQVNTDRWGLVAQVMQDRAIIGLETAQKHLS